MPCTSMLWYHTDMYYIVPRCTGYIPTCTFTSKYVLVCTWYIPFTTGTYWYILKVQSMYQVHTFRDLYQYVPVCTRYILVHTLLYHICLHSEGCIPVHTDFFSVCTFDFRILLRPPPLGQPVCLPAIYAPAHPLSCIPIKQVHLSAFPDLDKSRWLDLIIDQNIKVNFYHSLAQHTPSY